MNAFDQIQALLQERADYQSRLNLLPYDGTPEVKEQKSGKYLYVRKRVGSRVTSTYVGVYSDDLHQLLLRTAREARELRKQIRRVDRQLAALGYEEGELSARVMQNIDFARANLKGTIYDQAVLEGVATTFPQTEEIIENGKVSGVTASDVQKILNLKHAWEFVLDQDVILSESSYYLLCHIGRLVNEGFFADGGRIRGVPVAIGGTSYKPPIPVEEVVREQIDAIVAAGGSAATGAEAGAAPSSGAKAIDIAIELCLYVMKTQIFLDGNKRSAVIFANHCLVAHGEGLLVIPEGKVPEFKELLVRYYEGEDPAVISGFLKEHCWQRL